MPGLKWENADRPNPDPARVLREAIDLQHSDRELETFKRRVKEKYAVKERPAPRVLLAQALRGKIEEKLTIGQRIAVVRQSGKSDAARFIHKTAMLAQRPFNNIWCKFRFTDNCC